jgi:hypothetical protein
VLRRRQPHARDGSVVQAAGERLVRAVRARLTFRELEQDSLVRSAHRAEPDIAREAQLRKELASGVADRIRSTRVRLANVD